MPLLEEIQTAAVDGNSDLGALLRKCKVLAARLGSQPLENWLLWESNGYPEDVEVPDYRVWPLEIKGHFAGPFQSGLRNVPIPLLCIPEQIRKNWERYECRQSLVSIEAILKRSPDRPAEVPTGNLALILGGKVYSGYNCMQAWGEVGSTDLIELLNAVRNRVLDFALAIGKEAPTAGEAVGSSATGIAPAKVTQIFNTTVYGGSATLVGASHNSPLTLNIVDNNFESLKKALQQQAISDEDIAELEKAVESDDRPGSKQRFGPKVSSWIGKMVRKAADGTWNVGLGTAGNLLAQAISKFYGL